MTKTIDITELLQYLELNRYHDLSTDNRELIDNLIAAKICCKLDSVAIATTLNIKNKFVTDKMQNKTEKREKWLRLIMRLRLHLISYHISVINNYLHSSLKLSILNLSLQVQFRARETQDIARETQQQIRYMLNYLYSMNLFCIVTLSDCIISYLTITGVLKKQNNEFRRIFRGRFWLNRVEMLNVRQ